LIGANDPIVLPLPDESTHVDWEAELCVVIGTAVRRGTVNEAAAAIAGYTVANDISIRDFQRHSTQFMPGKAWESSTPVGPHLLVVDGAEAAGFPISCEVDGDVMQSSNTGELCFAPIDLVRYISTFTTLMPGDLILTGTPGGVGAARTPPVWLTAGQEVVTRIDGIGACRNVCS
jgi:acylpyruvate hydrolase